MSKTNVLYYKIGILFVAIALSPLSVVLMKSIMSYNFSEILLIPGFFLLMKSNGSIRKEITLNFKRNIFQISFFLLMFFLIIGWGTGGNLAYVYSDFRASLGFIFFTTIVIRTRKNQHQFKRMIYDILFMLSICDFAFLLIRNSVLSMDMHRSIAMVIAPYVMALHYLNRSKLVLSFVFFILLVFATVYSAMRINFLLIILYFIYLIAYLSFIMNKRRVRKLNVFFYVILIVCLSVFITPYIKQYFESNGSLYLHAVIRTEALFDDFEESESIRIRSSLLFLEKPMDFLIPQGLGWKNHTKRIQNLYRAEYNVLSSMDSSILYLIYHFGLILGLALFAYLLWYLFKLLLKRRVVLSRIGILYYTFFVVAIVSMILAKSWIFVYMNFGLVYSLLIVLIKYPDQELKRS